ncbi:hypothetical protein [Streptomyces sp. MP131-18]|uniref:terpene synthase family protein n=1 Tax=Streptomyces sp. MP131-18 TaxID=1857892 RepID=UPI00097C0DA9|nr:hypothetical protein [Streptomyces sp. MP131-18]ONK14103.1 (+)-T-muurolol synthase [Streptomyces sp. MP131-18]
MREPAADGPVLYCPIAPAVHPQAERIEAECRAWLGSWGLFADEAGRARLTGARAGELSARVLPRGSAEGVRLSADFQMWLFAFDDALDDALGEEGEEAAPGVCAPLLRVLDAPCAGPGGDRWARALREIRLRVQALATPVQLDRWVAATGHFLTGRARESARGRAAPLPSLNDYASHRLRSGAVRACVTLMDVVEGYELPPADAGRAEVRALTEMCAVLVCWDNDIVAARHEERHRAAPRPNLVDVTGHEYDCPPAEALARAVAARDRVMQRFQAVRTRAEPVAADPVRRYLGGLGTWVRGNLDWSVRSARHRPDGAPAAGRVRLTGTPPGRDEGPLPLPAVAWWWQLPSDAREQGPGPG